MGFGDWIMATGQAKRMQQNDPRPVLVVDRAGRIRWSEIFDNNPRLTRRRSLESQILVNGSGCRPYIKAKTAERWVWKNWSNEVGEVYLMPYERDFALPHGGLIMIEPNTKVPGGNKAWVYARWQAVVDEMGPENFVQCSYYVGGPWLNGVRRVVTGNFRQAMAVLSISKAFVGTEGGLHHAAAALGIPAIVLWSEFIAPAITGYPFQRNIRHANGTCGSRLPCAGCHASMDAITADEVVGQLREAAT